MSLPMNENLVSDNVQELDQDADATLDQDQDSEQHPLRQLAQEPAARTGIILGFPMTGTRSDDLTRKKT